MRLRQIHSVILATSFLLAFSTVLNAQTSSQAVEQSGVDFRAIVQQAKAQVFPAVVYIKCISESTEGGKHEQIEVGGSGVLISPEGEILTNWHVIDKAVSIRCLLYDGRHGHAEVLGSDKDTDLALLKLNLESDGSALPYAAIGDSRELSEGSFVMAMGAPWGLNRSVSIGIVSCVRRYLDGSSEYNGWIQTDAAINPGNSGGPLVNTAGEIVGINTLGMGGSADGMGFANPSEIIKIVIPQLREHGAVQWCWTGLQLQPLHDFNRDMYFDETDGVIVAETDLDSPARHAGFQAKDRIISVNGRTVTAAAQEDLPEVRRTIALLEQGVEAIFEIERDDEILQLTLTPRKKGQVEGAELALERLDFTVKEINQFDNPELHFYRQQGVFVYGVRYPGNASDAGLRTGDILTKIDDAAIETIDDVKAVHERLIENIDDTHRVVVVVLRRGLMRQIVLDFARDYEKQ
ncbi:MAG: PDZ domain-containing protein [Planctomycetes bacterium]|nr:PDZ domain-containing protein [Planctomycetota bacterium]NOG55285.1 PDZ domain-containing protein [Planctomycetota bacterium]